MNINHLSTKEKVQLAEELWESAYKEQSSAPISDEQKAILDARSAEFEKDQNIGTEWHLLKKQFTED
ncbi:Putative addiction module component [Marinomonas aquimarina]|uniref:Putative addiction module component n=1 Tax=Marinomonas aquimarina TaxID=295068 RepID=A0A1A8T8X0_9GAMM|nr:addiction module protein [Marinomonas aquimarina]SBS29137.1 Putative addiction module component [Marinomonas aquimarina]